MVILSSLSKAKLFTITYGIKHVSRIQCIWPLRMVSNAVAPSTEERLSIRESMRLFLALDKVMVSTSKNNHRSFEELCRSTINRLQQSHVKAPTQENSFTSTKETNSITNINILDGISCGSTMGCFAAIFLSRNQLSDHGIRDVISGSNFTQLINNPNILLHSLKSSICNTTEEKPNNTLCNSFTSTIGSSISRYIAQGNVGKLMDRLFQRQSPEEFPLVMFCSMTWTFPSGHGDNSNVCHKGQNFGEDTPINVGDHVFTIIKHSNSHFQMVQGYLEQQYYSSELRVDVSSPGMNLVDWRKSGSQYSTHRGFSEDIMLSFCESLDRFVRDPRFDSKQHKQMFGVTPKGNDAAYWPSFNFMELCDHHIEGCGERSLIEEMHKVITGNVENPHGTLVESQLKF